MRRLSNVSSPTPYGGTYDLVPFTTSARGATTMVRHLVYLILFLLIGAAALADPDPETDAEARRRARVTPIVEVVQQVGPAVVNIQSSGTREISDPFLRFFYGPKTQSLGSGVVIDPEGFVVTNAHVVSQAHEEVRANFNGTEAEADVIWIDQVNDLALLQIRGEGPFPYIPLGTAADVMIGETVVAIGNPYGHESTVSRGIVSATNRALITPAGTSFVDFIQTDAALHPGNSGGPLVNINGELIGVNTMVQYGTEAIGFAIPADRIRKILLERLTNYTQINGVYLGARVRPNPRGEALVHFVEPNSPAELRGLRPGDVIRRVGRRDVKDVFDFNKLMLRTSPGEEISLLIDRDGETERFDVELGTYSQNPEEILWKRLGLQVADRDAYNRRFQGVLVVRVQRGGPAESIGLRRGDLITKIEDVAIDSFENFYYAVTEATQDDLHVDVQRGKMQYEGEIRLRPLNNAPQ